MQATFVLSDDAAAAVEAREIAATRTARAKENLKQRRVELLRDTAAQLLRGDDPYRTVLPMLYSALATEQLVDATLGFVVSEEGAALKLSFSEGLASDFVDRCLRLDFGQAICGTVAARREPMHVNDVQRSFDPLADLIRSGGITAYASEPLIADDRLLGTLSFASRTRRSFEADDLIFFRSIAKLVARALDRARPDPGEADAEAEAEAEATAAAAPDRQDAAVQQS